MQNIAYNSYGYEHWFTDNSCGYARKFPDNPPIFSDFLRFSLIFSDFLLNSPIFSDFLRFSLKFSVFLWFSLIFSEFSPFFSDFLSISRFFFVYLHPKSAALKKGGDVIIFMKVLKNDEALPSEIDSRAFFFGDQRWNRWRRGAEWGLGFWSCLGAFELGFCH